MSERQDAVDDATAQLLIELAFVLPRGTDLRTHPISRKLVAYKTAIEASEAEAQAARADAAEARLAGIEKALATFRKRAPESSNVYATPAVNRLLEQMEAVLASAPPGETR